MEVSLLVGRMSGPAREIASARRCTGGCVLCKAFSRSTAVSAMACNGSAKQRKEEIIRFMVIRCNVV